MTKGSYAYGAIVTKTKTFTCSCVPADGKDLLPW
jgi:hypothetical protein